MKKIISLLAVGLAASSIYAGGYRVALQGQKALAMGHTGVAVVNSAELAFFNPSGLVFLENKLNISAGVTAISSNVKYQNINTGATAETDNPLSTPINLYASYAINDWLSAAIAVYTPYGSSVEYPNDWAGSDLVETISLSSIYINPVLSVKLTPEFSIGGGPIYAIGSVELERNIGNAENVTTGERAGIELSKTDDINNWGWVISTMFKPSEKVTLGASYRSKIELTAKEGDVTYNNITLPEPTTFTASLPLPAELTFGFSVQATEKLLLAAEFNRQYWSAYESLDFDFSNPDSTDSSNLRDYQNATTWRIGAQYDLNEKLTLRGGYYFDETPVRSGLYSPETPRNDAHGFTTGLTYNINDHLAIDASFLYLYFDEVDESYDADPTDTIDAFSGTYKSNAIIGGLGITYKL